MKSASIASTSGGNALALEKSGRGRPPIGVCADLFTPGVECRDSNLHMFGNFAHRIKGIGFRQEQGEDRLDRLWALVIGIVTDALRKGGRASVRNKWLAVQLINVRDDLRNWLQRAFKDCWENWVVSI
jgi:hypothetical protein